MPSYQRVRRSAVIGLVAIFVVFLFAPSVRAQGSGRKSTPTIMATASTSTTTSTTDTSGNSSWDQAIAAVRAIIDQQSSTIAQLQSALASETAGRQSATTTLQNAIASASATQAAALSAESTARQA